MEHENITSAKIKSMVPPHFAKRPKPELPADAPTLVSAFSCGGLFEIGALHAGFRPVLGVEFYPAKGKKDDKVKQRQSAAAADNYERNFGPHIIRKSIEDAVRDRDFAHHVEQHGRPNAFHCSPSCTNLSQGNTKGTEDAGDISAATAITEAIVQLGYPEIFTLENVEAYLKSKSWKIIRDFLYANGYVVADDVVWSSDYGLETGEGVPQDRKRLIVRAVKGSFAPPLPPKVPQRLGWYTAVADLIEDLPDGELAPWQLQKLPQLVKDTLIDAKFRTGGNPTTKNADEPSFTITASHARRPVTTPCAYLVRNDNTGQEWGKGYREDAEPSNTVTPTFVPSAVLIDGCNERTPCLPDQLSMTVCDWSEGVSSALLIERSGAGKTPSVRQADEPAWTIRSSIGTDQDGRNRNEVMNALVGCRVKKFTARAIARLQSVPDWYTLPDEMRFAGPLIGNGVPPLLSEAIMRSLLPYVRAEAQLRPNLGTTSTGVSLLEVKTIALVPSSTQNRTEPQLTFTSDTPELKLVSEVVKGNNPCSTTKTEGSVSLNFDRIFSSSSVVFVDAVGSGPCFGPVVACAVVLKPGMEEHLKIQGITDSKCLLKSTTPQVKREQIWQSILPAVECYVIAYATATEINSLGMGAANRLAMKRAVDKIQRRRQVSSIIVDGTEPITGYETLSHPVVKADQKYVGVSAASCLAKIFRDNLIIRLWGKLPYALAQHKGYGTKKHEEALIQYGIHAQHHLNNEFVKKYGIRQLHDAQVAGRTETCRTTALLSPQLLTAEQQLGNNHGSDRACVRRCDEAQGNVQTLSPAYGGGGTHSYGTRSLETGEETPAQFYLGSDIISVEAQLTKPFLKWAGGKTWAIPLLQEIYASHRDRRYFDLTLGSGAIPLALRPDRAYLSDKNPFLIQLWEWVRGDGRLTLDLSTDREYYLQCRNRFNFGDPDQAQLFYYLNHTCWRGLYRSSKEKFFNVPWGEYKKFHGQTDLTHYKQVIGNWEFAVNDWESSLLSVQASDFIVFDPPYHSEDGKGFTQYFGSFTEDDQIKAAQALAALEVPVVAFNAATNFIIDLYSNLGFTIQLEKAPRMISSTGDRAPALEMVATKNLDKKLVHLDSYLKHRQEQPDDDQLTTDSCQSDNLTYDEQRDRLHLERLVEHSFYEAGKALRDLRDRKLFRSTHSSWESYCQERFGFSHQNGNKKVAAANVVDVLVVNGCDILPSSVEQAYPLSRLKDERQIVDAWTSLTQEGKRPSGPVVRNVVAEICDRQAARGEYHNPWQVGNICQIMKKGDGTLAKYDGSWGIVTEVKTRQCVVKVWNGEVLVKAENLEELQVGDGFLSVCDRVRSLMARHMDGLITLKRGQLRFLEALGEQAENFEPEDVEMLTCVEAMANTHDASLVQATRLLVDNAEYLTDEEARLLFDALRSVHQLSRTPASTK